MLQDATLSKYMATHPTRFYYGTRGKTGVGADLYDLRQTIDGLALRREFSDDVLYGLFNATDDISVAGATGATMKFFGGIPTGYEKASRVWEDYSAGKDLTITAVLAGELGDKINITFARAAADAVSVFGTNVLLTIDNDGLTQPSHLQTLVNANPKLKGLIAITSTDDTAFPDVWVIAQALLSAVYLTGGTGRGWGYDLVGDWVANTSICFLAKKPGSGYDYEIEWVSGAALGVVSTRKKCTITFLTTVTTYALVAAAVKADPIAMEHLADCWCPGGGAGAVTAAAVGGKTAKLTSDWMTSLFIGPVKSVISGISANTVTYDSGVLSTLGIALGGVVSARLRIAGLDQGSMSIITVV